MKTAGETVNKRSKNK